MASKEQAADALEAGAWHSVHIQCGNEGRMEKITHYEL